jgi:uncharacterized Zn-finger protein
MFPIDKEAMHSLAPAMLERASNYESPLFPIFSPGKEPYADKPVLVSALPFSIMTLLTCAQCNKCYDRSERLLAHSSVHTGKKPFQCPHCPRCFTRRATALHHELKYHPDKASVRAAEPEHDEADH